MPETPLPLGGGITALVTAEHRFGSDAVLLADFAWPKRRDIAEVARVIRAGDIHRTDAGIRGERPLHRVRVRRQHTVLILRCPGFCGGMPPIRRAAAGG